MSLFGGCLKTHLWLHCLLGCTVAHSSITILPLLSECAVFPSPQGYGRRPMASLVATRRTLWATRPIVLIPLVLGHRWGKISFPLTFSSRSSFNLFIEMDRDRISNIHKHTNLTQMERERERERDFIGLKSTIGGSWQLKTLVFWKVWFVCRL